jgi:tetratricopeptide (TPR) repeat protein
MENGDFVRAAELARALCEQEPGQIEGHLLLAQILRRAEEFAAADLALQEAARLSASHPQLLWQRGLLENLLGRHAQALAAFDAIAPVPKQATLHYQRGVALSALGREEEALAAYARAVADDPQLFAARYAHYLGLRGQDEGAAAAELREVERLRRELPDWIRNNQLRLEAGELSRIEWPGAAAQGHEAAPGDSLALSLEPLQSGTSALGARLELWTAAGASHFRYDRTPTMLPLPHNRQVAVLRIEWPDGNVQNLLDVRERSLVVREVLFIKGSWGSVQVREP